MTEFHITLTGKAEYVLKNLIKNGYFKTREEVMRAGVLELGKEYAMIGSPAYYREQLNTMTQKKKLSIGEVMAELEKLEE